MTGAALHFDLGALAHMQDAIKAFGAFDRRRLLDVIGGAVESQTQRRISDEKRSPAGIPWPAWSPDYAKTRHGNQSLLVSGGNPGLLTSITHNVITDTEVEVGTPLIYGATHQFGDPERHIPQREYLGISDQDGVELERIVADFVAGEAGRALQ